MGNGKPINGEWEQGHGKWGIDMSSSVPSSSSWLSSSPSPGFPALRLLQFPVSTLSSVMFPRFPLSSFPDFRFPASQFPAFFFFLLKKEVCSWAQQPNFHTRGSERARKHNFGKLKHAPWSARKVPECHVGLRPPHWLPVGVGRGQSSRVPCWHSAPTLVTCWGQTNVRTIFNVRVSVLYWVL